VGLIQQDLDPATRHRDYGCDIFIAKKGNSASTICATTLQPTSARWFSGPPSPASLTKSTRSWSMRRACLWSSPA